MHEIKVVSSSRQRIPIMISLDSEPNPFRSFSYSLTMDGHGRGGGGRADDDEASITPSWVHSVDDDEQNSTTQDASTTRHEFKKSSLRSRWLILALTCVVMTGSYYA